MGNKLENKNLEGYQVDIQEISVLQHGVHGGTEVRLDKMMHIT